MLAGEPFLEIEDPQNPVFYAAQLAEPEALDKFDLLSFVLVGRVAVSDG